MGKGQLQYNSILKGHYRTFNLSKCELEGCHNFISSLNFTIPRICQSHLSSCGKRYAIFSKIKRINTSHRNGTLAQSRLGKRI